MSLKNKKLNDKFKSFINAEKKALKIFLDFISKNNIFFEDKKILARLHPEEFYKRKIIFENFQGVKTSIKLYKINKKSLIPLNPRFRSFLGSHFCSKAFSFKDGQE